MENDTPKVDSKKKSTILRDLFCFFIWFYAITKLFVFDYDLYLFKTYFPDQTWLMDFKFAVLLVIISIYWLTVGNKKFYLAIAFLLLFPFYFFFWKIGRFFFKNWFTAFAAISYASSFLQSLKFSFLTLTLFVTATLLIIATNNHIYIVVGIILLFVILILHFARRVQYAFIPSKAFVFPKKGYMSLVQIVIKQYGLPPELKSVSIEKLSPSQQTTRTTNLQFLVIANRATSFIALKLKEFQESKLILLYFIIGLLFTLCTTIILFAFLNLGLQKVDPSAFSNSAPKNIFFFLYYSFNTILTNGIADFYPISPLARFFNSIELIFGFLIIVILFFMYTNIKNDKAKEEMADLISSLNDHGSEIENYINQEYSTNISEAITEIEKLPTSMIKLIYFFTTGKMQ
jgi:hypothetical protein